MNDLNHKKCSEHIIFNNGHSQSYSIEFVAEPFRHPVGTSVESNECDKPVNSVPHYSLRVNFLQPSYEKPSKITSIYGLILKIIRYLDRFVSENINPNTMKMV